MLLDPEVEAAGLALVGEEELAGKRLGGCWAVNELAVLCYGDGWMEGWVGKVSSLSSISL